MKYRHAFHAGNFADLHKHLVWTALLQSMQRKDKGFLVLDTHAGAGCYDLHSPQSRQSQEATRGIEALESFVANRDESVEIDGHTAAYLSRLALLRAAAGMSSSYPGSPLWTLLMLRPQDRLVCFEVEPTECKALHRTLNTVTKAIDLGIAQHIKAFCADGFASISAWLPPQERRALILIDPPYENIETDFSDVIDTLALILARLANAVIAVWYPIKLRKDTERLLQPILTSLSGETPAMRSEFWLHPCDSRAGLNGSGMLLINPPWQLEQTLQKCKPTLSAALDPTGLGGWRVS